MRQETAAGSHELCRHCRNRRREVWCGRDTDWDSQLYVLRIPCDPQIADYPNRYTSRRSCGLSRVQCDPAIW
jgi:hypothetical protein